jgi:hypothetical protein
MIDWGQILYGAALSAVLAVVLLAIPKRSRDLGGILPGALAALTGPILWNAILRATHDTQFFTDLPLAVFPVSWQDTGSGVFTLATATLTYGLWRGGDPARRVAGYSLLAGLAALLVDVYLY